MTRMGSDPASQLRCAVALRIRLVDAGGVVRLFDRAAVEPVILELGHGLVGVGVIGEFHQPVPGVQFRESVFSVFLRNRTIRRSVIVVSDGRYSFEQRPVLPRLLHHKSENRLEICTVLHNRRSRFRLVRPWFRISH